MNGGRRGDLRRRRAELAAQGLSAAVREPAALGEGRRSLGAQGLARAARKLAEQGLAGAAQGTGGLAMGRTPPHRTVAGGRPCGLQ